MPCVLLPIRAVRWSGGAVDQILEAAFLQMLVETPAPYLLEYFFEFGSRDRLVHETLAAREMAVVPGLVLKLRRNAVFPQRQVLRQVGLEHPLGAIQRSQVRPHLCLRRRLRHPPQRMELVGDDLAKAELLRHVDLRRQQRSEERRVGKECGSRRSSYH